MAARPLRTFAIVALLIGLTACGGWDDGCPDAPEIPKLEGSLPPTPGAEDWPIYDSPEAPCPARS